MKRFLLLLTGLFIATALFAANIQKPEKAKIKGTAIEAFLIRAIEIGDSLIALQGFIEKEDNGEYEKLKRAIDKGRKLLNLESTTASTASAKGNEIISTAVQYRKQYLYLLVDSALNITEDATIKFMDGSKGWSVGAFSEQSRLHLIAAADNASSRAYEAKSLSAVTSEITILEEELRNFYSSYVDRVYKLPLRFNEKNGLPGTRENGAIDGSYIWNSPLIYLKEPINILRLTATREIVNTTYNGTAIFCLAEFEIYDAAGNLIPLREEMFEYNSLCTTDGGGIKALIDNNHNTYYHSAYKSSHDAVPAAGEYAYIQVILDEPLTAFRYRMVSRANEKYSRTPVDFGLTNGEDYDPDNVPEQDPYDFQIIEQVTDASQIIDGEYYILYGNKNRYDTYGNDVIGDGSGFYSGVSIYENSLPSSKCVFRFESAGEGKFHIHSIAQNYYIQKPFTWASASSTYFKKEAGAFTIKENERHKDLFHIYCTDTVTDELNELDGTEAIFSLQDWGKEMGTRTFASLNDDFELDGRNEWEILRVSVDNFDKMYLESILASIEAMGITPESFGDNPGQYGGVNVEEFNNALTAAKAIADAKNFAFSKSAAEKLQANIDALATLEVNPIIVGGEYFIVSAYDNFYNSSNQEMGIFSDTNDYDDKEITSTNQPYWGTFLGEASDYKEQFTWVLEEADTKDIETAPGNVYVYLRNKATGEYMGTSETWAKALPMSEHPTPYFFKSAGGFEFNIGSHEATKNFVENSNTHNYLHTLGHNDGKGSMGHICMWHYNAEQSRWKLINAATTSINNSIVADEPEGEILSTTYYSMDGKIHETPVKGVNIVKITYTNGAIKSKKIFVK